MNKIINISVALCLLVTILSGCNKLPDNISDEKSLVYLSAGVTAVKSPFDAEEPNSNMHLNALVCASTEQYSFPSNGGDGTEDGTIGRHLQVEFQSGNSQLINGIYYNETDEYRKTVFFTAFHPQEWTFTSNSRASRSFDGSDDIMYAPTVTGGYERETPTLNFNHLLTWLKLEICAENEDVAAAWGDITSLTIESSNQIAIDLSKAVADVSFGNEKVQMNFFKPGSDNVFLPSGDTYSMKVNAEEVGYVLCEAVQATAIDLYPPYDRIPEYYINIQSQHRSVKVPVDLRTGINNETGEETYFIGSTMGQQFTLSLKFKMGNTVTVTTGITDWQTGGIGIGKIEE